MELAMELKMDDYALTMQEVTSILKCSRSKLYKLIDNQEIGYVQPPNGQKTIFSSHIKEYIKRWTIQPAPISQKEKEEEIGILATDLTTQHGHVSNLQEWKIKGMQNTY